MQKKEDLVDILFATYNTNIQFLKIQIESILNQTHKNIHLIISDDNSTQKEVIETLKKYEEKDKRITVYYNKKNVGYIKNFTFLLEKSEAEYIMFSDHDDLWYKNKVKESLEKLKKENVDLVYSDAEQIDEKGEVLHNSYLKYKNMPIINGRGNILAFSRHIAIGCSQIITKKIKEQILQNKEEMMAHDWISVYLASIQKGVACIEKPLFGYRLHTSNVFGGRSLKQNLSRWKQENGGSYKAYIKYRDKSITDSYLNGTLMCAKYKQKLKIENDNKNKEEKVIKYYEKIKKTKIINLRIYTYFKYLAFKGIGKRAIKEIFLFHFPLVSYILYLMQ